MTTYRTCGRTAAVVLAVVAWAAGQTASGADFCHGPFCNQAAYPRYFTLAGYLHQHCFGRHAPPPVFQAAPWYLYWPYDGHFLTPAPVTGAFYGPVTTGNFPVNPYFPAPNYGHFGPLPGGPPPAAPVAPPGPGAVTGQ